MSSSRRGMVSVSRPRRVGGAEEQVGDRRRPTACPPSQHSRTAAAWCSQAASRTAEPLASTTTIGGLTAARRASSAVWLAGRSMWVRSKPSDSRLAGSPRKATTTSARPASGTASSASAASSSSASMPKPAAYATVDPVRQRRRRSASSGTSTRVGLHLRAAGALVARASRELADDGDHVAGAGEAGAVPSLLSSTMQSAAALRARAWCASSSTRGGAGVRLACLSTSCSTRATAVSSTLLVERAVARRRRRSPCR